MAIGNWQNSLVGYAAQLMYLFCVHLRKLDGRLAYLSLPYVLGVEFLTAESGVTVTGKMMRNIHLAPSDDEDLYAGFGNEEVAPALQTEDLEYDEGFQVKIAVN